MNEITIGDKIYISSKRAAEITGYAKDYVGQLCREGHVDAKMIGRSWYVYEPSIRAHRFGKEVEDAPVEPQIKEKAPGEEPVAPASTWERPTYTAEVPQTIPELPAQPPYQELLPPAQETLTDMQAAWREWFERKQQDLETPEIESPEVIDARNAHTEEEYDEEEREEDEVNDEKELIEEEADEVAVPLNRITTPEEKETVEAAEELVPIRTIPPVLRQEAPVAVQRSIEGHLEHIPEARVIHERIVPKKEGKRRKPRSSNAPITAFLIGLSVLTLSIAAVGTGLVDKYVQSYPNENPVIDFLVGKSEFERQ